MIIDSCRCYGTCECHISHREETGVKTCSYCDFGKEQCDTCKGKGITSFSWTIPAVGGHCNTSSTRNCQDCKGRGFLLLVEE